MSRVFVKYMLVVSVTLGLLASSNAIAIELDTVSEHQEFEFSAGPETISNGNCGKNIKDEGHYGCNSLLGCQLCTTSLIKPDCDKAVEDCKQNLINKCNGCDGIKNFTAEKCKKKGNGQNQACVVKCSAKCGDAVSTAFSESEEFEILIDLILGSR